MSDLIEFFIENKNGRNDTSDIHNSDEKDSNDSSYNSKISRIPRLSRIFKVNSLAIFKNIDGYILVDGENKIQLQSNDRLMLPKAIVRVFIQKRSNSLNRISSFKIKDFMENELTNKYVDLIAFPKNNTMSTMIH